MRYYIHFFFFFLTTLCGYAQSSNELNLEDLLADFVENLEEDSSFDFNTIAENLAYYIDKPININKTPEDALQDMFLSDLQIISLKQHIATFGPLNHVEELQTIPGFDINTIRRIRPFIQVIEHQKANVGFAKQLISGRHTVYLRYQRVLETKKGFSPPIDSTTNRYLGDEHNYYFRYKYQFENKIYYGITAEKDPGEVFRFDEGNRGFDFYSAHVLIKNPLPRVSQIALGDYVINLGQGLIFNTGFSTGKNSFVTNIKRGGKSLRQYSSVNEASFLRGLAIELAPTQNLSVLLFASAKNVDASLDTITDVDEPFLQFSSINISGFHRTKSELAKKAAVGQFSGGGRIRYNKGRFDISLNSVIHDFSEAMKRQDRLSNLYAFEGSRLWNSSIEASYNFRKFHLFGEYAIDINAAQSSLFGIMSSLDEKADLSLAVRNYAADYYAINARPFSETGFAFNERGIYLGLQLRPSNHFMINSYFDIWQHPWLRSTVDSPSNGYEYFVRGTYIKKRKFEAYAQFKFESKLRNKRPDNFARDQVLEIQRSQYRLHFAHKLNKNLELRNRIEISKYKEEFDRSYFGYLFYQDVLYKPIDFPLWFIARIAVFDTQDANTDYNTRIYAYENDILNSFSIPAYYRKGIRSYIHLRYKGIRNLVLEGRYAITYLRDHEGFGSGLEEIQGPKRSDLKFQIKYNF